MNPAKRVQHPTRMHARGRASAAAPSAHCARRAQGPPRAQLAVPLLVLLSQQVAYVSANTAHDKIKFIAGLVDNVYEGALMYLAFMEGARARPEGRQRCAPLLGHAGGRSPTGVGAGLLASGSKCCTALDVSASAWTWVCSPGHECTGLDVSVLAYTPWSPPGQARCLRAA